MKKDLKIAIAALGVIIIIVLIVLLVLLLPRRGHYYDEYGDLLGDCTVKKTTRYTDFETYFLPNGTLIAECQYYWGPGASGGTGSGCSYELKGERLTTCETGKFYSAIDAFCDWICIGSLCC